MLDLNEPAPSEDCDVVLLNVGTPIHVVADLLNPCSLHRSDNTDQTLPIPVAQDIPLAVDADRLDDIHDGPDLDYDLLPGDSEEDAHEFNNVDKIAGYQSLRKITSTLECDKIQKPAKGPFQREDLKWYGNQGHEEAWIPYIRLPDFIRGEEMRERLNCIFSKRKSITYRANLTGPIIKKTTTYRCCFGPQNYREFTENSLPKDTKTKEGKQFLKLKIITGLSQRRGCRCSFTVTQVPERKGALLLKYVNKHHLDKNQKLCHGMDDPSAYLANAHIAPRLSRWSRAYIERCLMARMTPQNIVKDHNDAIVRKRRMDHLEEDVPDSFHTRDMQLTVNDVRVVKEGWRRQQPDYSTKDEVAVKIWAYKEPGWVYKYKETDLKKGQKFKLIWGSQWQLKKLAIQGHKGAVAMDATFKTNIYGYPLYTLMTFNKHGKGLPCVWAVLEEWKEGDVAEFLEAVNDAVNAYRAEMKLDHDGLWKPSCFIVDCALEERNAILRVFPKMVIQLCIWHVRKAWSKNLITKVNCPFAKAQINRELDALMYNRDTDPEQDSIDFMNRWARQPETSHFVKYYLEEWHAKITGWATQMRTYPHANQDTNGAIERYHGLLKLHLRQDKASVAGRKLRCLIEQTTMWENSLWADAGKQYQGRIRNKAAENTVWASMVRSQTITADMITLREVGREKWACVVSASDRTKFYLVQNYDLDCCTCTCGHSNQGNSCKHYIAILIHKLGWGEREVLQQLGSKFGTITGGVEFHTKMNGPDHNTQAHVNLNVTLPVKDMFKNDLPSDGDADSEPQAMRDGSADSVPQTKRAEDIPKNPPPVEDFVAVVKAMYDVVGSKPTLCIQALAELKGLKDTMAAREARQNFAALEAGPQGHFGVHTSTDGFTRLVGCGGSLKQLKDWHEISGFGIKRPSGTKPKGYNSDKICDSGAMALSDITNLASGANAPDKLVMTKRKPDRYCKGSQKDLDKRAEEALKAMAIPWVAMQKKGKKNVAGKGSDSMQQISTPTRVYRGKGKGQPLPVFPKPEIGSQTSNSENVCPAENTPHPLDSDTIYSVCIPPPSSLPPDVPYYMVQNAGSWALGTAYEPSYTQFAKDIVNPARGLPLSQGR